MRCVSLGITELTVNAHTIFFIILAEDRFSTVPANKQYSDLRRLPGLQILRVIGTGGINPSHPALTVVSSPLGTLAFHMADLRLKGTGLGFQNVISRGFNLAFQICHPPQNVRWICTLFGSFSPRDFLIEE